MSPRVLNDLVIDMALRMQCPFGNLFPCGVCVCVCVCVCV